MPPSVVAQCGKRAQNGGLVLVLVAMNVDMPKCCYSGAILPWHEADAQGEDSE